jgi:hypothetical protein
MNKNPSDRKTMPGQGEDQNRDAQWGQHKEGQKGMGGSQDWKKEKEKEHKGTQEGQQGQPTHRQGEPMGQQPKPIDSNKQRQGGGTDRDEGDDRKRRPA